MPMLTAPQPLLRFEHRLERWWKASSLHISGLLLAGVFYGLSHTPSLLPRSWLFQGIVGGITGWVGYGLGIWFGYCYKRWVSPAISWWWQHPPNQPSRRRRRRIGIWWIRRRQRALLIIRYLTVSAFITLYLFIPLYSVRWQQQLARLMELETESTVGYMRSALVAVALFTLLLLLSRGLRHTARLLSAFAIRRFRVPLFPARLGGIALVTIAILVVVNDAIPRVFLAVSTQMSARNNETVVADLRQPEETERSGSPASLVPWETLGRQGRSFTARGLRAAELTALTGKPALEPIRVYAGLDSAPSDEERMSLVLAELDRTDAWSRRAIVVIPTTGTGWVNNTAAQAMELLYGGDIALLATQYGVLPSWISVLNDAGASKESGRVMVERTHERLQQIPQAQRPKFYVYGESLGTQAGEGAFRGLADIRETVDGILWVGPPNGNDLWRQFVARREPGTTEVNPVYAAGLSVRFATSTADIQAFTGEWARPRVLYLQHPSDPVIWWSPQLLFERPDWLAETPGHDRLEAMRWYPIVTFWQVAADLGNAAGVPNGHGHNYGNSVLDGFAAISQPPNYDPSELEQYREWLELALHM